MRFHPLTFVLFCFLVAVFPGKGEEWVEFELDKSKIVRLSSISIDIPMLPYGPLSVRTMRIDTKADSNNNNNNNNNNNGDINKHRGTWRPSSSLLTVANRTGWQRIDLEEPIDAQVIKLVCLTNQASISLSNEDGDDEASAVGFFTVKFE